MDVLAWEIGDSVRVQRREGEVGVEDEAHPS